MATRRRVWPWLVLLMLLTAAATAGWLWWQRQLQVMLPVVNATDDYMALEFHGAGLQAAVRVRLDPHARATVPLRLSGSGPLRVHIAGGTVAVDSLLLGDAGTLRDMPQRFDIKPGGRFVLTVNP